MLFNSVEFLIFFTIVVTVYFMLPYRVRWLFLLVSSCIFYMAWNPAYILLLIFISAVNHICSNKIYSDTKNRKKYLITALVISFGVLFVFKYLTLINETFNQMFENYPVESLKILLPMGISFYTFQAVGYTIDVYRGEVKPKKMFLKLLFFITFFPQLVAGPIERSDKLMPQLFKKQDFSVVRLIDGLEIMLIGFFKKMVVADRLAIIVNTIYNNPYKYTGLHLLLATVLFAFQVYCDFCGYSQIAVGAGKILGIELMDNFQTPYFSKSIKEFWRRWHISLSTWFKDYLYIPLGGNRKGKVRTNLNVFITFMLSGLWHGANWTFVLWGALHGLYQIIGNATAKARQSIYTLFHIQNSVIHKAMQVIITFGLVCFAWIFFRANSIEDSKYILSHLFDDFLNWFSVRYVYDTITSMGVTLLEFIIAFLSVCLLIIGEFFTRNERIKEKVLNMNFALKGAFCLIVMVIILTMGVYHNGSQFIYFQF